MDAQTAVNVLCLQMGHAIRRKLRQHPFNFRSPASFATFNFYCCTENAGGLDAAIRIIPFLDNPGIKRGWPDILVKLMVLRDGFGGLVGPTLFLDLDIVIAGRHRPAVRLQAGEYCIIRWVNWRKQLLGRRPRRWQLVRLPFRTQVDQSQCTETFLREMRQGRHANLQHRTSLSHPRDGRVNWWPDEWVEATSGTAVRRFL